MAGSQPTRVPPAGRALGGALAGLYAVFVSSLSLRAAFDAATLLAASALALTAASVWLARAPLALLLAAFAAAAWAVWQVGVFALLLVLDVAPRPALLALLLAAGLAAILTALDSDSRF